MTSAFYASLVLCLLDATSGLSLTGYRTSAYGGRTREFAARPRPKQPGQVYKSLVIKEAAPATKQSPPQTAPDPKQGAFPYWYDPRIHNWGNIGLGGKFHAFFAPLATAMIDRLSYDGMNVRGTVLRELPADHKVLDLCCGVGISSAPGAVGVDTSREMLEIAQLRRPDCRFEFGNAESYGADKSFDTVTVMFATHEMPPAGRRRVLRNAMRVARSNVIVVDIHPDFKETLAKKPMQGASFLSGEPYVLDYMAKMDSDLFSSVPAWGWTAKKETLLPGHVAVWRLERISSVWGI